MANKPTYEELERRITRLEKEAAQLRLNEEENKRYRLAVESALDAIFFKDLKSRYLMINSKTAQAFGVPKEEIIGKNDYEIMRNRQEAKKNIEDDQVVFKTCQAKKITKATTAKDGNEYWFQTVKVPQLDDNGNIFGLVGIARDITERKQAEEALKESEERYRAMFENAAEGILVADVETKEFKYTNPAICAMLGYTEQELKRMSIFDVHPKDDLEFVISEFEAQARREKVLTPEIPCLRRDGTTIYADIKSTSILLDGRDCSVGFFTDITERKQAEKRQQGAYDQAIIYAEQLKEEMAERKRADEERRGLEAQLQHAQRMESIGILAGGVAHDFNNLLMGIQGYASLILRDLDEAQPQYNWVRGIEDQVKSGADLTRQLLGFAKGGKYDVKFTDINEIVRKSSSMFGRTKKDMTIKGEFQQDIWTVEVDQGQIGQVLLNLYVNAWQAMPAGGNLYLETSNVTLDENFTKPYNLQPGRYVKVSVTDTGSGMDEATQRRIFDPFFTTKKMGWGTGLGLASAYGIVRNHDGIINVYSKKGHGCTFNVYLPAVESVVPDAKPVVRDEQIKRGIETVLLVDDEQTVLDVGKELLSALGYKVLSASGGQEAIDVYKANKDKIDLVLLDIIMPGMGGGETYDMMKEISQDIKVLLTSGFSIDSEASEILQRGCNGFIQKPFNMRELSGKIREVLEKEQDLLEGDV